MNGIILYESKYGATKRYAEWLSEETGFPVKETGTAKIEEVAAYDTVILGGGLYAAGIAGFGFLKKNWDRLKEKKIFVFCDGIASDSPRLREQVKKRNFKEGMENVPLFYARGAWDIEHMAFMDKTVCKMLVKSAKGKEDSENEMTAELAKMGMEPQDFTDKSLLTPLLEAIRK